MKRLALIIICTIIALAITATAGATTIQTTDTSQPWQTWVDASQAPTYTGTLPLTIASDLSDCGGMQAQGCTSFTPAVDQTTGQILPGPPAQISTTISNNADARATLYHELGQVFWVEYMTPADETRFMQIVGLDGTSADWGNWRFTRVQNGVTLTFPPFEWFAEGYRYCATYGINQPLGVNDMEGLGYPGSEAAFAAQQRQVCQLIDQVGADNRIATPAQAPPVIVKATRHHRHGHQIVITRGRRRSW
jgi:hypothetical protein